MIINKNIYFITILFCIFIFSFSASVATDYAWYINRTDWYSLENFFYDSALDVSGAWETFITFLNSKIISFFGNLYINYWLFGLTYSILSIFILFKLLESIFVNVINIYLGVMSYILLAYFTSIYIGTRPENIYVSSIVILLYTLHKFNQTNHYKWIYISSLISIFGALSHPNGMVLFVILFIFAIKLIFERKIKYFHLITNTLLVLSLFAYGILFGQTLEQFMSLFTSISLDAGHTIPFYYEPKRYITFILAHTLIAPLFLFGLFTLFLYIKKYLLCFKEYFFENLVATSALFIIIYLTFIGAKWEYYLSLLFPFVVISIVEYIQDKNFNKNLFIGIGFVLMIVTIGKDFKKNEEFLSLLHIPSQRVNIVNEVKSIIKDSTVYAPMRLYVMHKYHNRFVPLERVDIGNEKIDFVILDFSIAKEQYDKKLDKNLEYMQSFIYNDHYYNLFRVNDAK